MATRLQRKANRKNARSSTGPSTPEGKARSSQNATTHGLFARDVLLPDENPQEFFDSVAELEQELGAIGGFERRLVHHITCTEWRLRRLLRLETGSLTHQLEKQRLRELRDQADLSTMSPPLQPNSDSQHPAGSDDRAREGERGSQGDTKSPGNTESPDGSGSPVATRDYQQTTQQLGASTVAYQDKPVLLTLSLYESRLNRKYLTLLKQLRQIQKNRPPEASAQNETPQPHHETTQPSHETAEPTGVTAEPGSETADLRQAKEMSEDSPACGTRPGPQDQVTSVA